MSESSIRKEEYEVLAYSKLNHVKASIVQIVTRNTHVHRALELGLALEGSGQVRVEGTSFPIGRGSLTKFTLPARQASASPICRWQPPSAPSMYPPSGIWSFSKTI